MKRENIIVSVIILTIVLGYFVFLTISRQEAQKNVFLNRQKVEIETLAPRDENLNAVRYKSRSFNFNNLPLEIQKQIKNEQIRSHLKINTLLKDFLVRFHKEAKDKKDVFSVDPEKLPSLAEISMARVGAEKVESIYKKNKNKFAKGHDPVVIKQQIKVELLSNDAYEYMVNVVAEIRKSSQAKLPSSPQVPEEWLITPSISPSYGEKEAANHLIWIGFYGCTNCSQFSNDLGLLLQKYSLKDLRVTFIPWSFNDIDTFSYLNLAAFCLRENTSEQNFWRYHSVAMNSSDAISSMKNNDLKKAQDFFQKILISLKIPKEDQEKAFTCSKNLGPKNELLMKLISAKRKLEFIPNLVSPTAFLNGRLLDLEGTSLFEAVDLELSQVKKK